MEEFPGRSIKKGGGTEHEGIRQNDERIDGGFFDRLRVGLEMIRRKTIGNQKTGGCQDIRGLERVYSETLARQ